MGKVNPNGKKYYAFFSKSRNNTFITITDVRGQVIVSQSAGSCKITSKKKKKS
jgi:ribosomal protein S11